VSAAEIAAIQAAGGLLLFRLSGCYPQELLRELRLFCLLGCRDLGATASAVPAGQNAETLDWQRGIALGVMEAVIESGIANALNFRDECYLRTTHWSQSTGARAGLQSPSHKPSACTESRVSLRAAPAARGGSARGPPEYS
jgi:hypothetical protein